MSARTVAPPETVKNCVQRRDGLWLVQTTKGRGGTSQEEIHEGARVLIINGEARRA